MDSIGIEEQWKKHESYKESANVLTITFTRQRNTV